MCGISGIYRFDGQPVDAATLERMKNATAHRGPDDEGILLDKNVGLTHNRLSILDLSPNGHQPMHDQKGGRWIVYNGEVYNFQEVRRTLESLGYSFRSNCDTEVILYAYREWGRACLDRFNGMWAFAIFDERTRELFLARDRMGIKPLYYYADHKQFVFASETKAILPAGGIERRINRQAIPEVVAFRYLVGGRTLFENIHELQPGHCMTVGQKGVRVERYWDIPANHSAEPGREEEWIAGFEERIKKSVAYRLIADVPVGCALSGGVDSSLVTAMACEASTSTMKTFSIGFDVPSSDERPFAKHVSDVLGVENYNEVLDDERFFGLAPKLVWHMDEPINHPNSIGIWLLAKIAREKVTVLLSGEGGDELIGGYRRFQSVLRLRDLRRKLPGSSLLAKVMPANMGGRTGHAVRALRRDEDGAIIWSSAYLHSHLVEALCGPGAIQQAEAERRKILQSRQMDDPINRHLYYELKTYLVSLLIRVDKMCMAHSLENRVPLLDYNLVEYATRMPAGLKYDRERGKVALMELAGRRFGTDFFGRRKMGFGIPSVYFRGKGLAYLKSLITSRSFRDREWMDSQAIDRLIEMHEQGRENLAESLWVLGTMELWARTFIDRPGVVSG